jgi:transketolase
MRRLSVEAGTTMGWASYASAQHGIDRFGASAPGAIVARELGMHVDAVVARFKGLLG